MSNYNFLEIWKILPTNIKISLFNKLIPKVDEIKFLGLTLDKSLSFFKEIDDIKAKCHKRINLLKIISNKSWSLTESNLVRIYRSIIDYAAIIFTLLCETNKKVFR
jgi:hypothetical protein